MASFVMVDGQMELSFAAFTSLGAATTLYTFTGVSIGTEAASRRVLVVTDAFVSVGRTVTSVVVAGVTATLHVQAFAGGGFAFDTLVNISSIELAVGTTATIVVAVSGAGGGGVGVGVYRMVDAATAPTATMFDVTLTGSTLSGSLDVPAGGAVIAGAMFLASTAGNSWSGATEDYDATTAANGQATGSSTSSLAQEAGRAISVTNATTPAWGALAAVSWG